MPAPAEDIEVVECYYITPLMFAQWSLDAKSPSYFEMDVHRD